MVTGSRIYAIVIIDLDMIVGQLIPFLRCSFSLFFGLLYALHCVQDAICPSRTSSFCGGIEDILPFIIFKAWRKEYIPLLEVFKCFLRIDLCY